MTSTTEANVSRMLRELLARLPIDGEIGDSADFRTVLIFLERFLPTVLAEVYPEWLGEGESLDGIYPHIARKTGEREIEIFGLCILISDQNMTPIHLRIQVADAADEISWLELRLGEKGQDGIVKTPYPGDGSIYKKLHAVNGRAEKLGWVYKVTFGTKIT